MDSRIADWNRAVAAKSVKVIDAEEGKYGRQENMSLFLLERATVMQKGWLGLQENL